MSPESQQFRPDRFMGKAMKVVGNVGRTVARTLFMAGHMPEHPLASRGDNFYRSIPNGSGAIENTNPQSQVEPQQTSAFPEGWD